MTIALEQPNEWPEKRLRFMGLDYDALTEEEALDQLILRSPDAPFVSVVTPNSDILVRIDQFPEIRPAYLDAEYCFNDSRIVAFLARLRGVELPTITGADLVLSLFHSPHFDPNWPLLLVGGSPEIAAALEQQFGLSQLTHCNAPMGLRQDQQKLGRVIEFIEDHPARFTFLAVGSPEKELIAHAVSQRHKATGVGLCIGAAMEFLVYPERRAPRWMSRVGLEWLFRLSREPARLWRRYLIDSPKIFGIAARDWAATLRTRK